MSGTMRCRRNSAIQWPRTAPPGTMEPTSTKIARGPSNSTFHGCASWRLSPRSARASPSRAMHTAASFTMAVGHSIG